jgi:hypothetical protein
MEKTKRDGKRREQKEIGRNIRISKVLPSLSPQVVEE